MLNNFSYRISLGLALALHGMLVLFLVVKFTHTRTSDIFTYSGNIIQAEVVNMSALTAFKNMAVPSKKTTMSEKHSSLDTTVSDFIQQSLLAEQKKELIALKKDKRKHMRKITARHKQQMERMLQNQLAMEKQQFNNLNDGQQVGGDAQNGPLPGEMDKYHALVKRTVSAQWIKPEGTEVGDVCQVLVNVAPGGVVLDAKLVQSSGKEFFDRSAQTAVFKSSPLPVPEDSRLFDEFRVIKLTFREEGIIGD